MRSFLKVLFAALITAIMSVTCAKAEQHLFVSDSDGIQHGIGRSALDGSGYHKILNDVDSYYSWVGELAVDNPNQKLYYVGNYKIKRCNFDGSGLQTLFSVSHEPGGLVIGGNKMFWTEGASVIWRANLDGSNRESMISTFQSWSLAYDNIHNKLYYSDSSPDQGGIFRANPDGSNVEKLFSNTAGVTRAYAIAVDPYESKIYWSSAEYQSPYSQHYSAIKSANFDGTGMTDIITGLQNPLVTNIGKLDIDYTGHKLYWTDQAAGGGKVQRMSLDGTGYEVTHYVGSPWGIAVSVPEPASLLLLGLGAMITARRR